MSWRIGTMLAGAVALSAAPAAAQQVTLGGSVAWVTLRDPWPAPGSTLRGGLGGAEGEVWVSRFGFRVAYTEGTLRQADQTPWTLVDGEARLGVRLARWVRVSAGPHARTYVTPRGRYRRVSWEAALGLDAALVEGVAGAYAELRRAVSSRLNTGEGLREAYTGEAGLRVGARGAPLTLTLAYRFADGAFGAAAQRESGEQLVVGIALGGLAR